MEASGAQIKMRSGQAGRHSVEIVPHRDADVPEIAATTAPRTIAWFTVTACTVSGQRGPRI